MISFTNLPTWKAMCSLWWGINLCKFIASSKKENRTENQTAWLFFYVTTLWGKEIIFPFFRYLSAFHNKCLIGASHIFRCHYTYMKMNCRHVIFCGSPFTIMHRISKYTLNIYIYIKFRMCQMKPKHFIWFLQTLPWVHEVSTYETAEIRLQEDHLTIE